MRTVRHVVEYRCDLTDVEQTCDANDRIPIGWVCVEALGRVLRRDDGEGHLHQVPVGRPDDLTKPLVIHGCTEAVTAYVLLDLMGLNEAAGAIADAFGLQAKIDHKEGVTRNATPDARPV